MWGRLESRCPPFVSRVRSPGLRADAYLSSIIEENSIFLIWLLIYRVVLTYRQTDKLNTNSVPTLLRLSEKEK